MNKKLQALIYHYWLPLVVFLTGAAVLIIEVAAIRILSPYFGNTLYMTSSVLSVILAALSVGYYFGGRLADKQPSEKLFFSLILMGGVATLLLQLMTITLLPQLGYVLPLASGPLIVSLLMFFLPAVLLGTLSPFVIKLQTVRLPKLGTGTTAGEVFFYSTLGSISGSLLTGFVLVPFLGLDATIMGTGIFLILLGSLPLVKLGITSRSSLVELMLIAAAAILVVSLVLLAMRQDQYVYLNDSKYQQIKIYDYEVDGRTIRYFQQDRNASSAMYLDNPTELVYGYSKYYEIYKAAKPNANEALVIGGAAYSIPKALLADSSDIKVDVAEIDPETFRLAKEYFAVKDGPRLDNHVADGRRFLANSKQKYDIIFNDAYYSLYTVPAHLTTKEFFIEAKNSLSKNGVFMANLIGSLEAADSSFIWSEIKTFSSVFDNIYLFGVSSAEIGQGSQNVILVGINGDKKINFNSTDWYNSNNQVMANLAEHQVDLDQVDLSSYTTLTDNHAPVTYLLSQSLLQ